MAKPLWIREALRIACPLSIGNMAKSLYSLIILQLQHNRPMRRPFSSARLSD